MHKDFEYKANGVLEIQGKANRTIIKGGENRWKVVPFETCSSI